ncbi:MAG: glycosyltransferase family 39 protein [Actinomycetota bacterium]
MASGQDSAAAGREWYRPETLKRFARDHWPVLFVLAVMLAALLVRRYYVSKHTMYTADSYYFLTLSRSIRDTFTYTVRGVTHTKYLPGYPVAIWLFGYVAGGLVRSANLISVFGATLVVWVTYGLGSELFESKYVGMVACLLVAFQPTFLKWTVLPMTEGLFTLLFASGLYLLLTGCKRASPPRRLAGAVLGGLAFSVRWEGILFLPLMVLIVLIYFRGSELKAWEPFVMLGVFALPMGIYVTRNLIATGKISHYIGEYREYSTKISFADFKHRLKVYGWNGMSDALFPVGFALGSLWMLVRWKWKAFLVVGGWFSLFVAMHMFWYYAYERFMAPAAPAVALAIGFLLVDLAVLAYRAFEPGGTPLLEDSSIGGGLQSAGPKTVFPWLHHRQTGVEVPAQSSTIGRGLQSADERPWNPTSILAVTAVWLVLALVLAGLLGHGMARASSEITKQYQALADDHGGVGMKQAADWLEANAPGRVVAVDAGPYFTWEYYPGDVLYLRAVPWDLPVETADVEYVDTARRLYERGVRYIVIGVSERPVSEELTIFGLVPPYTAWLTPVASWVNHYEFEADGAEFAPPVDVQTVIFEVKPPPGRNL